MPLSVLLVPSEWKVYMKQVRESLSFQHCLKSDETLHHIWLHCTCTILKTLLHILFNIGFLLVTNSEAQGQLFDLNDQTEQVCCLYTTPVDQSEAHIFMYILPPLSSPYRNSLYPQQDTFSLSHWVPVCTLQ